jgi:hypothetical protein
MFAGAFDPCAEALRVYGHFAQFDLPVLPRPTDLARLPVLRKSELGAAQKACHPLGALVAENLIMPSNRRVRFMSLVETVMIGGVLRGFCMPPALGQAILCKIAFPII